MDRPFRPATGDFSGQSLSQKVKDILQIGARNTNSLASSVSTSTFRQSFEPLTSRASDSQLGQKGANTRDYLRPITDGRSSESQTSRQPSINSLLDDHARAYSPAGRVSDPESESGSGSRRAKMTHKSRKKLAKVHVLSVGWRLLRAEGFFCNLDILYEGLGIGKLQFLIKKKFNFFSAVIFFQFLVIKALDPDPDRSPASYAGSGSGKMNTDPKPSMQASSFQQVPVDARLSELLPG
jgi:hypothetical protein